MELTDQQQDILTELINVAFSRTAASLSVLAGNRVQLDIPDVFVVPVRNLPGVLQLSGPVSGDALLLMNQGGAVTLVALLTGADAAAMRLGESDKEVLTEVGNILLTACLGMFGEVLKIRFCFTVPRLQLDATEVMLQSFVVGRDELQHALVVGARFRLQGSEVTGCLVIVLGVASLDQLMRAAEQWADAATSGSDHLHAN
jgi:chemotaxis protein CheC